MPKDSNLVRAYRNLHWEVYGLRAAKGEIAQLTEEELRQRIALMEARKKAAASAQQVEQKQEAEPLPPGSADPISTMHDTGGGRRIMKSGKPFS